MTHRELTLQHTLLSE